MLYAMICSGKLEVGPLGWEKPEMSVSFDERKKLVAYFESKIKGGSWDGHMLYSSSMDWADEHGWPEPEAREYLTKCVIDACARVKAAGARRKQRARRKARST